MHARTHTHTTHTTHTHNTHNTHTYIYKCMHCLLLQVPCIRRGRQRRHWASWGLGPRRCHHYCSAVRPHARSPAAPPAASGDCECRCNCCKCGTSSGIQGRSTAYVSCTHLGCSPGVASVVRFYLVIISAALHHGYVY